MNKKNVPRLAERGNQHRMNSVLGGGYAPLR